MLLLPTCDSSHIQQTYNPHMKLCCLDGWGQEEPMFGGTNFIDEVLVPGKYQENFWMSE